MKINTRMSRVNDEIMKELAQIFRGELKDPRIGVMTSVLRVETTQDLKYCKVYVSVLGNDEEKKNVLAGLKNASGFIRHLLAERINLRATPELTFKLDDSVEYAVHMSKLIDEVSKTIQTYPEDEENEGNQE
ncbi:MAG: 30S ribosome-binding factor RbfA [Clostridiales bacterium]|nr:30S ribosome-binding factor RbfA [Clostridiales bacterium]